MSGISLQFRGISERIRFHLDENVAAIALGLRCDGIDVHNTQSEVNITGKTDNYLYLPPNSSRLLVQEKRDEIVS